MIDIRFLRENPDAVRENIRKKFQDEKLPLVDEAIRLDAEKRAAQQECEQLKAARNKLEGQRAALRPAQKGGRGTEGRAPEADRGK